MFIEKSEGIKSGFRIGIFLGFHKAVSVDMAKDLASSVITTAVYYHTLVGQKG
jgi:hypothetical protein